MRYFVPVLLFFCSLNTLFSQALSGKVTSAEDGQPLTGVTVAVKGTSNGATTDATGMFSINCQKGAILTFSYTGFQTKILTVGDERNMSVVMEPASSLLQDVVIVAYGTVKKSDLTGSVSSITSEDLVKTAPVSLDQAIQGRAAGVQVTQVSGRPGGETSIRIRGSSSINAGNEPLYVVDGMLITSDNGQTNAGGIAGSGLNGLSAISP
ncbi:MAG: carboxypeptidase-like regulatory domain-containing protein, partial [Bacteroidota bacterium]